MIDPERQARLDELERRREELHRRYRRLMENHQEARDLLDGQRVQLEELGREIVAVDQALAEARS